MPRLLVLYASQTGHALDTAERIASSASRRGWACDLRSIECFDVATLPTERRIVFVISTTGDGDFPDSALHFWRFLARADVPAGALAALRTATFGLGDSSYVKYNAAARKLSARIAQLGAASLCVRGFGDWQAPLGIVGALESWLAAPDGLWAALDNEPDAPARLPLDAAVEPLRIRYHINEVKGGKCSGDSQQVVDEVVDKKCRSVTDSEAFFPFPHPFPAPRGLLPHLIYDDSTSKYISSDVTVNPFPILARVAVNDRITANEWAQDVRLIAFDTWVDGREPTGRVALPIWEAGDVADVFIENSSLTVAKFAERLQLPLDSFIQIKFIARGEKVESARGGDTSFGGGGEVEIIDSRLSAPDWASLSNLPEPPRSAAAFPPLVTVRVLLARYLAINSSPSRGALESLAAYASNAEQADKLRELATREGAALFHSYVTQEMRSWVDILHDFDSVKAPLALLLDLIPPLLPRSYSIASSCVRKVNDGMGSSPSDSVRLEIAVGVVEWTTPFGGRRKGIGSEWLASRQIGDTVSLWIRRGSLRVPHNVPLLLIGPGTGVAPMRALIQEAEARALGIAPMPALIQEAEDRASPNDAPPPRVELYFGCRTAQSDHLFGTEFNERVSGTSTREEEEEGSLYRPWRGLDSYVVAFSRDGGGPGPEGRSYVQDHLLERAESVRDLIASGAHIRISGSAKKMPAQVIEVLRTILAGPGGLPEDGVRALAQLERVGRLRIEAWS
jgi:sulfite reductase alpha subunit-like flavoprotein